MQQRRTSCKAFGDLRKHTRKGRKGGRKEDLLNYEMQKLTVGYKKTLIAWKTISFF